jgi:hypothetical protein
MSENATLHPVGVLKEAAQAWIKNFIPVTVLYGLVIVFAKSISFLKPLTGGAQTGWKAWGMSAAFFAYVAAVVVINSFVTLIILRYLEATTEKLSRPFDAVWVPVRRLAPYLKAFVAWIGFIFLVAGIALLFVWGGNELRNATHSSISNTIKMGVLLGASTMFVILIILAAWYGFFFSLAPLVASYEGKGPFVSLMESRRLIRGNAFQYLVSFVMVFILHILVGVGILFIMTRFTHERRLLNIVDPAIASAFGPLWVAAWYMVYKKLREIKGK